jgi:hypothetical protein
MTVITMAQALNTALRDALKADESVVVFGEDVGDLGGVFRVTDGLSKPSARTGVSIPRWPNRESSALPSAWQWPAFARWWRCSSTPSLIRRSSRSFPMSSTAGPYASGIAGRGRRSRRRPRNRSNRLAIDRSFRRCNRRSIGTKTGRCIVVHEAQGFAGMGAEIVARVQERCFHHLEAPVLRVCGFDIPYSPTKLENYIYPDVTGSSTRSTGCSGTTASTWGVGEGDPFGGPVAMRLGFGGSWSTVGRTRLG